MLFIENTISYPIFDSLNARKASKQELSSHFIMSKSVAISNYFWGIMEWSIFIPRKPEADASAIEARSALIPASGFAAFGLIYC